MISEPQLNDKVLNNVWISDGYKDTSADRLMPHKRLKDAGHYHPSELISDKISSMLLYFQYVPIHVTRSVNRDSDHVVSFDDEIREIVRNDALERVLAGLDFFDASINRIAVDGCTAQLLWGYSDGGRFTSFPRNVQRFAVYGKDKKA